MRFGGTPEPVQAPPAVVFETGDVRIGAVVEIEERPLRALEEHLAFFGERLVQIDDGVADERRELLRPRRGKASRTST